MPQYFTPAGLNLLSGFESGGNPTAQSSTSSASGLYGFLSGTWQQFAPQAGVDTSLYPTAASAPGEVQTSVAEITPISNWTCPGCDAGITNAIAGNSSLVSNSPEQQPGISVSSGDGSLSDILGQAAGNANGELGSPYLPGAPDSSGIGAAGPLGGAASTVSGFWSSLFADIENIAARFGLIILGIVIVGIGAWAAAHGEFGAAAKRAIA